MLDSEINLIGVKRKKQNKKTFMKREKVDYKKIYLFLFLLFI